MSIKQETNTPTPLFSKLVRDAIIHGPGGWDDSDTEIGAFRGSTRKSNHDQSIWWGQRGGLGRTGLRDSAFFQQLERGLIAKKNGFEWSLRAPS
jgi:hypothetical protein